MDLERIIGSLITESGPQPFVLHTKNGRLEVGIRAEPDEGQADLTITQQQRFVQLIAERADISFAKVRLGQYYDARKDQWIDVLSDAVVDTSDAAFPEAATPMPDTPVEAPEAAVAEAAPVVPVAEAVAEEPSPPVVEEASAPVVEALAADVGEEPARPVAEAPSPEPEGPAASRDEAAPAGEEPVDATLAAATPSEEEPETVAEETRADVPDEEEEEAVIDAVLLPNEDVMLEKAIRIAVDAHSGQLDKAGDPYILHPLRMMLQMRSRTTMMVAVLHDLVEDTGWTLQALRHEGFSDAVVEAVDHLTRRPGESYQAFIERAARHPVARRVKLADLEDNMDVRRLDVLTDKDQARLAQYQKAWQWLKDFGF